MSEFHRITPEEVDLLHSDPESDAEREHKANVEQRIKRDCMEFIHSHESTALGSGLDADVFTLREMGVCIKRIKSSDRSSFAKRKKRQLPDEYKYRPEPISVDREVENQLKARGLGVHTPDIFLHFSDEERNDYIVMETVDGYSVKDIIEKQIELPPSFDHDTFFEILERDIEKMHAHNLYHRDLAPGNVMVDFETGEPVIIDFGQSSTWIEMGDDDPNDSPYLKKMFVAGEGMIYRKMDSDNQAVNKWKGRLK